MLNILVQNNLCFLSQFDLSQVNVLFAPIYKSNLQLEFFKRRFTELKKNVPHICWRENVEFSEFESVLSWNSTYEIQAFGQKIIPMQNRLFQALPFKITENFTDFRIKIEKELPSLFLDAIVPTDTEVLDELEYYFQLKKLPLSYLETRNGLIERDDSTRFSSALSCGALDVRHLYNEVRIFEKRHEATKSTGWIIFELLWREYFYWHYQEHGKDYFSRNGLKGSSDFNSFTRYNFDQVMSLQAHPFFQASLRELYATGFLSNRARQIFASIWINDLKLDWRSGAMLFEENLLDYDVYSNYGNWMYLAGVGVDPRGKRYFNVEKQLSLYDRHGLYLQKWGAS